jgi:hypothetical protein
MKKLLIIASLFFLPLNNLFAIDAFSVKERIESIKNYYTQYPDITMTTKITNLYEEFYLKDYTFIQEQILKRENVETLKNHLDIVDEYVQMNYKNEMSFADLNFIARVWVNILSSNFHNLDYFLERYNLAFRTFNKHHYVPNNVDTGHYTFIQSSGIVIPHVSETGIVPILELNEGFGFEHNNRTYSIDFLAVATNQLSNFDYLIDQNSFDVWYHDFEHLSRAERLTSNKKSFQKRIKNIVNLRQEIKKINPTELYNQAELAFFKIFHESQQPMPLIKDKLLNKIKHLSEIKDNIQPTEGFNSIEQYYSYVDAAKDLNLECGDGNIIEQYKVFLDHLYEGYKILLDLADFHDPKPKQRQQIADFNTFD